MVYNPCMDPRAGLTEVLRPYFGEYTEEIAIRVIEGTLVEPHEFLMPELFIHAVLEEAGLLNGVRGEDLDLIEKIVASSFGHGQNFFHVAEKIAEIVQAEGGGAVIVDIDIGNLGGLNLAYGREIADAALELMRVMMVNFLSEAGTPWLFRTGGDEFKIAVLGSSVQQVEKALGQMLEALAVAINSFEILIPHRKYPNEPVKGFGLGFAAHAAGDEIPEIKLEEMVDVSKVVLGFMLAAEALRSDIEITPGNFEKLELPLLAELRSSFAKVKEEIGAGAGANSANKKHIVNAFRAMSNMHRSFPPEAADVFNRMEALAGLEFPGDIGSAVRKVSDRVDMAAELRELTEAMLLESGASQPVRDFIARLVSNFYYSKDPLTGMNQERDFVAALQRARRGGAVSIGFEITNFSGANLHGHEFCDQASAAIAVKLREYMESRGVEAEWFKRGPRLEMLVRGFSLEELEVVVAEAMLEVGKMVAAMEINGVRIAELESPIPGAKDTGMGLRAVAVEMNGGLAAVDMLNHRDTLLGEMKAEGVGIVAAGGAAYDTHGVRMAGVSEALIAARNKFKGLSEERGPGKVT